MLPRSVSKLVEIISLSKGVKFGFIVAGSLQWLSIVSTGHIYLGLQVQ